MDYSSKKSSTKGFTLIEILLVIAVISTLSVVVILVINPVELLKQARDSKRFSELNAIDKALNLVSLSNVNLGQLNTLYISLPDPTATTTLGTDCAGLSGLPPLPSGWSYHCAASSSLRNVDGTGWIPVNFTNSNLNKSLLILPIDPRNTISNYQYYTYAANNKWELTAVAESTKFNSVAAKDGGPDPLQIEIGLNLNISPFAHGLLGYWSFDVISGTLTNDLSGFANNGTLTGSPLPQSTTGVAGSGLSFVNTVDNYVSLSTNNLYDPISVGTIIAWVKLDPGAVNGFLTWFESKEASSNCASGFQSGVYKNSATDAGWALFGLNASCAPTFLAAYPFSLPVTDWNHVAYRVDGSGNQFFLNGVQRTPAYPIVGAGSPADTHFFDEGAAANNRYRIGATDFNPAERYSGLVDEVRIYQRPLSATEIAVLYNSR